MVKVNTEKHFKGMTWNEDKQKYVNRKGEGSDGFYLNETLKTNLDNFFIEAVNQKWDGVLLVTGMEGSGKSTTAFTIAKYCDPTFPGELINDEECPERRSCERIVFTSKQFHEAVDKARPGQSIVWDEFVLGGFSGDATTSMQKEVVKKMVTIRKKRLFIFLVIPTIFMLRRYFAVLRSRACLHQYSPDGITRGDFKFYSYDTKRILYMRGVKEWDMGVVKPDFIGSSIDTQGYFFNLNDYEQKKDEATISITEEPEKKQEVLSKKRVKIKLQRDLMLCHLWYQESFGKQDYTYQNFCDYMLDKFKIDISLTNMSVILRDRDKLMAQDVERRTVY